MAAPDPVPPQSRAEQAAVVQRVGGEAGQLAPGPALRLGPPAQPEGHLPSPVQASKVQQWRVIKTILNILT